MTSINTNLAAVSALRTLQQSNAQLDATQGRISSGLKIGEAKDNAAYWSISTALKSDNKAMATVKDALSLGAATVDTAYQGLNSAIDVLNDIKAKLTAATQAGVDKEAVQAEIKSLQDQLKSIANSSTFSGENWLSVDSTVTGYNAEKSVVSSFTRDASGAVALGTITVDVSKVALFDGGTNKDGILDTRVALGNLTVGGLAAAGAGGNTDDLGLKIGATPGGQGSAAFTFNGFGVIDGTDSISFKVAIDGGSPTTITLTKADLDTISAGADTNADAALMRTMLGSKIGSGVTIGGTNADITITSNTMGGASAVQITDVTLSQTNSNTTLTSGGLDAVVSSAPPAAAFAFDGFGAAKTLDGDDAITFDLMVDGGVTKTIRIDQSVVNSAISGETGGVISDAAEMDLVLEKALANAGLSTLWLMEVLPRRSASISRW